MNQPGKPGADASADLKNPATAGYRSGQDRQQPAHFGLAGEPETGSGGSFVRGQNALGQILALGHRTILPSTSGWGTSGVFRPVQFSVIVGGQPVAGGVVFELAAFLPDPGEALEQRAEQWVLVLAVPDQRPGVET